jgi:hypothetical protein
LHLPFVPHGFPCRVNWIFGFVEIGTFSFFFLSALDVLAPFLKIFALTHLRLVRGFLWPLDACFSRRSPGSDCVVNRYACATTMATSGVSCMKSSCSSDDNVLMLFVRSSFLGHSVLLLLCFGSRCLSLLDSDVLL